jgi:DNA polymerase III delta prime subunit
MSSQLWQQMRVSSLNDMVGNTEALAELKTVQNGFVLIHGPMGCGKTSTALAFAYERTGKRIEEHQTLECLGRYHVSHIHASAFDLDDITQRKMFSYKETPTLIIVDEAQEMTQKRQQSKLKTIPPRPDLTLVFCTTDPQMIEDSIRDRCAKIRLGPLSARELPVLVMRACEARGVQYTPEIVQAMNRAECFRPRAIFNAVDALARGKSIAQAVAGQAS